MGDVRLVDILVENNVSYIDSKLLDFENIIDDIDTKIKASALKGYTHFYINFRNIEITEYVQKYTKENEYIYICTNFVLRPKIITKLIDYYSKQGLEVPVIKDHNIDNYDYIRISWEGSLYNHLNKK